MVSRPTNQLLQQTPALPISKHRLAKHGEQVRDLFASEHMAI